MKSHDSLVWYLAPLAVLIMLSGCAAAPDIRAPAPVPVPPPSVPAPAPVPVPEPVPLPRPEVRAPQAPVIAGDPRPGRMPGGEGAGQRPPSAPQARPPAVVALAGDAERHLMADQPERAAAALERALRIAPDDALLWHRLAQVRLNQGQAEEAESLAAKSNDLARGDRALQADNWQIIAQARRLRGDERGAREALERSRRLQPERTG